jgi:glucose-6-phosphate isomerase
MLPKINPVASTAWLLLKDHFAEIKSARIKDLFADDQDRFNKLHLELGDILFDYSKNLITDKTISALLQLADECRVKDGITSMFNGDVINETEHRSVLHIALRNFSKEAIYAQGTNVMPAVKKVLRKMKTFSDAIHNGTHRGYTGKRIRYVVNIGIGGSDLGPLMVAEALRPYKVEGIETYFVSNIDGTHIAETLKKVKPERTLFLVAFENIYDAGNDDQCAYGTTMVSEKSQK